MWASSRPNKRRELDVQLLKQQISWLLEKKEVPTTLTRLTPPELLPSCWSHNSPLEGFLVDPDDYDEINDDQGDDDYNWWYKLFVVYVMMTMVIRPMMMMMIDDMHCLFCYAKEGRWCSGHFTPHQLHSHNQLIVNILMIIADHSWSYWIFMIISSILIMILNILITPQSPQCTYDTPIEKGWFEI